MIRTMRVQGNIHNVTNCLHEVWDNLPQDWSIWSSFNTFRYWLTLGPPDGVEIYQIGKSQRFTVEMGQTVLIRVVRLDCLDFTVKVVFCASDLSQSAAGLLYSRLVWSSACFTKVSVLINR